MTAVNLSEIENPRPEKRVWGPWATAGFGLAVVAVSFLIQVLVGLVIAFIGTFSLLDLSPGPPQPAEIMQAVEGMLNSYEGLMAAVATCLSSVFCTGLILIMIKVRGRAGIAEYLGLRRISGKAVLAMLAIAVGFLILSAALAGILKIPDESDFIVGVYNTSVWPALLWVALIILAPVFEEAFFRGFLFEGFRQSRIGVAGAIVLTALIWAVFHVQYSYYGMATIFLLGIILGVVRYKTGSLWSPMVIHAFNNTAALLMVALQLNG